MNKETTVTDQLPDKLSELIFVALEDLRAIRCKPEYIINAGIWHTIDVFDETCHVCLAGAVMANRLNILKDMSADPMDFPKTIKNKLYALNQIRVGKFYYAAVDYLEGFSTRDIDWLCKYQSNAPKTSQTRRH